MCACETELRWRESATACECTSVTDCCYVLYLRHKFDRDAKKRIGMMMEGQTLLTVCVSTAR